MLKIITMRNQEDYNLETHRKCNKHGIMPKSEFYVCTQKNRHGKVVTVYRCILCSKKERASQYAKAHASGNKPDRSWVAKNPERVKKINRESYERNKDKYRPLIQAKRQSLRLEILEKYSSPGETQCVLCLEKHHEFLVLDHIDGGGTQHRVSVGGGDKFYKWVARNNPINLRVLCHNCNFKERLRVSKQKSLESSDQFKNRTIDGKVYPVNKKLANICTNNYKQNIKQECLVHYSKSVACACCGVKDTDVLSIDHISGEGRKHRKSVGEGSTFYAWLRREKFPPGYKVLCLNCNFSIGCRGYCPHGPLSSPTLKNEEELFSGLRDGDVVNKLFETPLEVFRALSKTTFDSSDPLPQSNVGLNYLDNIFPHRFDARTGDHPSLREALSNNNLLRRTVRYIIDSGREPTRKLVLRNLQFSVMAPAHFFPSAAVALYSDLAKGKDVFDPFLGWGGRTLGAYCAGVRRIVGTDLQKASCDGCNRVSSEFAGFLGTQGEFFPTDFRDFAAQTLERFDLIFTSPPFIGSENYGLGTSSIRVWTESILVPLASACVKLLKKDGTVAIHGQDSKAAPVLSMILSTFLASGFSLSGERKYGKKPGQAVLIFKMK